jgi:hypothetical protein
MRGMQGKSWSVRGLYFQRESAFLCGSSILHTRCMHIYIYMCVLCLSCEGNQHTDYMYLFVFILYEQKKRCLLIAPSN